MKSSTNSPAGSRHWYNTLLGRIRRTGEFMKMHPENTEHTEEWGKQLEEDAKELIEGYSHIQEEKSKQYPFGLLSITVTGLVYMMMNDGRLGPCILLFAGYGFWYICSEK